MLPEIVILDAELTVSLPSKITAATGMDALSHNLEAYCSPFYHPMAEALGGKVTRSEKGWGVGLSFNEVSHHKPWMMPAREEIHLLVSHQDQVTALPTTYETNAQVLASSSFCPYYMVQYGEHFLSIQGHPEFSPAYSKALMASRQGIIPEDRIEAGTKSLSTKADRELSTKWLINFMEGREPE